MVLKERNNKLHEEFMDTGTYNELLQSAKDQLNFVKQRIQKCERCIRRDTRLGFPPQTDDWDVKELAVIESRLSELVNLLETRYNM